MLEKQKERGKVYAAICASPAVVFAVGSIVFCDIDAQPVGRRGNVLPCISVFVV